MGLLSDPEYGSVKWVKVLKKVHNPLCLLFYAGAIVWFVLLSNKEFNNETYFSENALLPGLVKNELNAEQSAKQFYNEFLTELKDKYDNTEEIPVPWLVAKMSQLYLEVYTHNFTLNYPLGHEQVYRGTNVYGILRAPRASSLEALVLTAPYRPLSSHQKSTAAGIALMLAFAQFARVQKYWAKDIIFLVTEHEQLGMQAWLEAYHGIVSDVDTYHTSLGTFQSGNPVLDINRYLMGDLKYEKCLNPGKLKGRSGSLQAAINLEFHTPKIKYIEVKIEGLNGQLPNLDLVNLVYKLCDNYGIHHSFKGSYSWMGGRGKASKWTTCFRNMMSMATAQIAGVPNGNHGLFHRFGIEAITLEGRDSDDPGGQPPRVKYLSPTNVYHLGILLESTFRSLNNLLERFHQSYFFYMLAATNRFVSIGQYMPSLCLFSVAMLVRALFLWVNIKKDDEKPIDKTKKSSVSLEKESNKNEKNAESENEIASDLKEDKEKSEEVDSKALERDDISVKEKENDDLILVSEIDDKSFTAKKETTSVRVFNIVGNYLLVHILGYAVMNCPAVLCHVGAHHFNQPSELSVYYGLILISLVHCLAAPYIPKLLCATRLTYDEMTYVNILALIELSTVCLSVGLHNFPLGMGIAVVYTPLALSAGVRSRDGRWGKCWLMLKRISCLLLHPLSVVTIGMILYSRSLFPEEGFLQMAGRGRDAAMQAVMFSIVDSMIYGNWLFNVATTVLFPIWTLFWQISCIRVDAKV